MRSSGTIGERGTILFTCVIAVMLVSLASITMIALSDAIAGRLHGGAKVDRVANVGESGLAFLVEEWRKSPAFLDDSDTVAAGFQNAQFGVVRQVGGAGGTFQLLSITDVDMGSNTRGKMVDVRAELDGMRYAWRALLSPNIASPIQGVGTRGDQTWSGPATFSGNGDLFAGDRDDPGNPSDIVVQGSASIGGDANANGNITTSSSGTISGNQNPNFTPPNFPDQQAAVDAAVDEMNNNRGAGFWSDPRAAIVVNSPVTAMEVVNETTANLNLGTGWSSTDTPFMRHLAQVGGVTSLPAGNYAFGRLWIDGGIMTIKAPVGGGDLVLADLYITNNGRLILDTTDGPFRIVTPLNNAYENGSAIGPSTSYPTTGTAGFTAGGRWNGTSFAAVTGPSGTNALQIRIDGTAANNLWVRDGGIGSSSGPKPDRGTTNGYDDWSITDGGVLAIITPAPTSPGVEMFMKEGGDLVLHNGARLMGGVQPGNLAALQNPATTAAAVGAMPVNAPGFVAWSGGAELPRFNIDVTNNATPGASSFFTGLTYGGFEGTIGALGHFEGAFVGEFFVCAGTVVYDSRLRALLGGPLPNTHHVVVKFRVGG